MRISHAASIWGCAGAAGEMVAVRLVAVRRGATPKAFHQPAQGCEGRASLGPRISYGINPERVEWIAPIRIEDATLSGLAALWWPPGVGARASRQPRAG